LPLEKQINPTLKSAEVFEAIAKKFKDANFEKADKEEMIQK